MSISDVDIANLALLKLGADSITSFSDANSACSSIPGQLRHVARQAAADALELQSRLRADSRTCRPAAVSRIRLHLPAASGLPAPGTGDKIPVQRTAAADQPADDPCRADRAADRLPWAELF